jgi:hypothetical protein
MHYIMHNLSDGPDDEELKEVPKVVYVQYWPFTDDHWPQPMVVAHYELVEVVEGELPRKNNGEATQKIVAKIAKKFL